MRWIGTVLAGLAAGVALGAPALQESRPTPDVMKASAEVRLYLFLSPTDRDLATLAGEARRILAALEKKGIRPEPGSLTLRPVLLLADFKSVGRFHTDESFFNMVKELRDVCGPEFEIRLYDEEGLAWAEKLAIERTPAWALVRSEPKDKQCRAHLVYGARARIEEAASCTGR